jgi:uncharacterized membrane protein
VVQDRIALLRRAVVVEVEDRNRLLYHILRGGVVVSVAILLFGFVLGAISGAPGAERSIPAGQLGREVFQFTPGGYLSLGVLVLMLTPVARVFLSVLSFLQERDSKYVLMTALVLMNLIVSLLVLG